MLYLTSTRPARLKDTCALVSAACRSGRVDCVVQSTDKNFMASFLFSVWRLLTTALSPARWTAAQQVPVGGAVVWAPPGRTALVDSINDTYPGRASLSPLADVLLTLLHMGADGWVAALAQREACFALLRDRLARLAELHGERLLATPHNPVSVAITLSTLRPDSVGLLGSMLFTRAVSGTRAVPCGRAADVCGVAFAGFGQHHDSYTVPYLTAAAGLGITPHDVDAFCARLAAALAGVRRKESGSEQAA